VRFKFSCVRSSHDLFGCAHAHSLEGTLPLMTKLTLILTLNDPNDNEKVF